MKLSELTMPKIKDLECSLNLTEEEQAVFGLLCRGKTVKEITTEVDLSHRTVERRIASVKRKIREVQTMKFQLPKYRSSRYESMTKKEYMTQETKWNLRMREQLQLVLTGSIAVLNDVLELPDDKIDEYTTEMVTIIYSIADGIDDYDKTKKVVGDYIEEIRADRRRRHSLQFDGINELSEKLKNADRKLHESGKERTILNVTRREMELLVNSIDETMRMLKRRKGD